MFTSLKYMDAARTIIQAQREDGSLLIIEPTNPQVWATATGGTWGEVADFVVPPPPPVTAQAVKDEAYRRIVAIVPEWRQRNLTARAAILSEKGRANWTAQELAEWEAGEALWARVKALRDASDVIEALDPIPQDYTADERWPE